MISTTYNREYYIFGVRIFSIVESIKSIKKSISIIKIKDSKQLTPPLSTPYIELSTEKSSDWSFKFPKSRLVIQLTVQFCFKLKYTVSVVELSLIFNLELPVASTPILN